ncbi:MAG: hypothetical protein NZM00_04330, partial [Anaerolinea sp.]|nr:hypothetical protein [Anaerolinea sp.]
MASKDEVRAKILERARQRGGISYDEILSLVPDAERDITLLDDLIDELLDAGVDVAASVDTLRPDSLYDPLSRRRSDLDFDQELGDDDDEIGLWVDDDLIDDAGYQQALDSDDVVGLYLKEAGRVPLLTAEEEVMLAKRMEK